MDRVWNTDGVIACLQWRDGARLASVVRRRMLTRVAQAVRAPGLYRSPDTRSRLLDRLRALSPAAFEGFLGAPELFRRLVLADRGEPGFEAWMDGCLRAEAARAGAPAGDACWTATGDFGLDADRARFEAPRLDTIPVDHRSPNLDTPMEAGQHRAVRFGGIVRYDAAEAAGILEKLDAARATIVGISPAIWEVVRQSTRVLQLRRDDSNPTFHTSASCNSEIGRVILLNPHLDTCDVPTLANALVHESIHAVLYAVEQDTPLLPTVDPRASAALIVPSPWTGSRLHLHTYLHACFVWFGLVNLWNGADRPLSPAETRHATRALGGFTGGEAVARLRPFVPLLGPGVWGAVRAVSELVRAPRPPAADDADPDAVDWDRAPVASGRHGLAWHGRLRVSGTPVFGKISTKPASDAAILREAAILDTLRDVPGVPRRLATTIWGDRPVLVLEALATRDPRTDLDTLLGTIRAIARTLGEVHRRGVVHRDVRAEHLLWRGAEPVLVDFSSALAPGAATGGTVGNGLTSPPDQLLPDRPEPGFHWDTYALCVVFFQLLVGRPPACQEEPGGRLSPRGVAVWEAARIAVVRAPRHDDPDARRTFAEARAGADYPSLLADDPAPALGAEDEAAVLEAAGRLGGSPALAEALVATLRAGLDARIEARFADGDRLAEALDRVAPTEMSRAG